VLEEKSERRVHLGGVDRVVIVEHEEDVPRDAVDVIDQVGEDGFDRRGPGGLEGGDRVGPAARLGAVQRRRHVEKEPEGIAVSLVEGEPGDTKLRILPSAPVDPRAGQRGLPEACRGGERRSAGAGA